MPDSAAALLAQGLSLHREGRAAEAEALYRRALGMGPGSPEALHLLGLARLGQGDAPDAAHWISLAHAAAPEDAQIAYNLGAARLAAKNFADRKSVV